MHAYQGLSNGALLDQLGELVTADRTLTAEIVECLAEIDERGLPAADRRAIAERDGRRCTFMGEDGHRCESHDFVEFDHVTPYANGGDCTADNSRLLCNLTTTSSRAGSWATNASRRPPDEECY